MAREKKKKPGKIEIGESGFEVPITNLVEQDLGHRLGRGVEEWSEEIGGGILILVGIAIALGLLG